MIEMIKHALDGPMLCGVFETAILHICRPAEVSYRMRSMRLPLSPQYADALINHERMPVLLSSDFETWLAGTTAEAFALAKSFDPARMRSCNRERRKKICW